MADALSRKYEDDGSLFSLSFIVPYWLQDVHHKWLQDPKISILLHQLQQNYSVSSGYSWHNEELHYKGRLYLCKKSQLKSTVLFELHASPTAGHSWFTKTYERVKCSFFWEGMKHDVLTFVVECEVCQCNKGETVKSLGTLQPLLIPPTIWKDISMDFITGLPKSRNKFIHNGRGGLPFQVCSFLRSSPPIYCIHGGSNFHGPGLQASWHAALYCFRSRPNFHKQFLARTI